MTNFAGMSTFSPDGTSLVTMSYGTLTLRTGDATLGAMQTPLFPSHRTEEPSVLEPVGPEDGVRVVNPSQADVQAQHITGDMVQGGQIWIADVNGTAMGTSQLLVPRATNTHELLSRDQR